MVVELFLYKKFYTLSNDKDELEVFLYSKKYNIL